MLNNKELKYGSVAVVLSMSYEPIMHATNNQFNEGHSPVLTLLIQAFVAMSLALLYFLVMFALNRVMLISFLRRRIPRLKPPSEMEGYWYQHLKGVPERPHSISQIRFDWVNYRWIYEGAGLDEQGNLAARWRSYSIYYDDDTQQWFLMGKAHLMIRNDNIDNYKKDDKDGNVLTILTLGENREDAVCGVCIDYGAVVGSMGRHFSTTLTEITPTEFRKIRPGGFKGRRSPKLFSELKYDDYRAIIQGMTKPQEAI